MGEEDDSPFAGMDAKKLIGDEGVNKIEFGINDFAAQGDESVPQL